jgi:hypothetical protein
VRAKEQNQDNNTVAAAARRRTPAHQPHAQNGRDDAVVFGRKVKRRVGRVADVVEPVRGQLVAPPHAAQARAAHARALQRRSTRRADGRANAGY